MLVLLLVVLLLPVPVLVLLMLVLVLVLVLVGSLGAPVSSMPVVDLLCSCLYLYPYP